MYSTGSLLDAVAKTEVVVRGLHHEEAGDLEITLMHQEHSCDLLVAPSTPGGRPTGVQFGVPPDRRVIQGFGANPGK